MFRGSCVALVTPMTQEGAVDEEAFSSLIKWHQSQGTRALVIAGTTGEASTLTQAERDTLLECAVSVVKAFKQPIPVIAGTGSNCTQQTIEDTQRAKALGCDGALVVTPYYNKPTQEGLYLHYKKITEAVDLPLILYNVPHRTGCDLLPQTAAKLSYLEGISGIKDATGDLSRLKIYQKEARVGFELYTGDDESAMSFITLGGHGVISVVANIVPKAMQTLCEAVLNQDLIEANTVNKSLKNVMKQLFIESNPIPVKWALQEMGRIQSGIRLPLTPFSKQYHEALKDALHALKLFVASGDDCEKNYS